MFLKLFSIFLCIELAHSSQPHPQISLSNIFDFELYERVLDSELCRLHLDLMNAFEFYDASFRTPQGIMSGNFVNYGNYFQCLAIKQEREGQVIEGKHCMINFQDIEEIIQLPEIPWFSKLGEDINDIQRKREDFMKRMTSLKTDVGRTAVSQLVSQMRLGVCIPKSCTVREGLAPYFNSSLVTVNYTESHCRLPGDKPYAAADYVAFVIFGLIAVITILSSGYELRHIFILKTDPKSLNKLYSSCSVYTNTKRLFTFDRNPGALECLDGIRSLSIIWIIIGHTVLILFIAGFANIYEGWEWYSKLDGLWVKAAEIGVDTFFMLTGLLLVYTSVSKLSREKFIKNIHLYYLNRFLRLFPILALGILLQASVLNYIEDGPNWHYTGQHVQYCRSRWWAALLHIQNYYDPPQMCLSQTWYLGVDMQLYILSPLVLIWMLGNRRSAWTALTITVLVSFTAAALYCFLVVNDENHSTHFYWNTLTRAPPFFVGMFFGYLLHVCREHKIILPKWFVSLCWVGSLIIFICVIYSFHLMNREDVTNEFVRNSIRSFSRGIWAVALGWLIFACVHGYGGPINWFLSLTIWKFIARISYALYIFHHPVQFVSGGAILAPHYFSMKTIMYKFIEEMAIVTALSVVACVLVDAPFSTLQKLLLTRVTVSKSKPTTTESSQTKPSELSKSDLLR